MNKAIIVLMLCGLSGVAFADGGSASAVNGQQQQSQSQASNAGNTQQIINSTPGSLSESVKTNPNLFAPPLVSSNDTCMGSTSGGVSILGVGITAGTTWTDNNCKMLKNSREMWNMGMKGAALARMCMDSENKEALELTGFECPQTKRDRDAKAAK